MDWKLEVIVMPVSDPDRAKTFYSEQLGFTVDHDTRVSNEVRLVQLTPPGSACSIVIGTGEAVAKMAPGSLQGVQLVVSDIAAARAHLLERGVDVSQIQHVAEGGWADGHGGPWNAFLFFNDPDGNGWTVQETPGRD